MLPKKKKKKLKSRIKDLKKKIGTKNFAICAKV